MSGEPICPTETPKAPKELVDLAGLEIERRRLLRELIGVEVEISELRQQIRVRGIEVPWMKEGFRKNHVSGR
jgi:hypothetical protein